MLPGIGAALSPPRRGAVRFCHAMVLILSALSLLLPLVSAGAPEVHVTRFKNLPKKLFYFDDSPVVLLHDGVTASVYRSENEGKSWSKVDSVGEVTRLIDHPHAKEMAFAIGRKDEHWVTYNRGSSWQSFKTPIDATVSTSPLSFHAKKSDWILFQGTECESDGKIHWPWDKKKACWDTTYYTTDAFRSEPKLLLETTSQCTFAHANENIDGADENMVLCIAYETKPTEGHRLADTRLFRSNDWFDSKNYVDLGIGKHARGVVGLGIVSKFMVVAVHSSNADTRRAAQNPMQLYVSTDGVNWRQAQFPHSVMPSLVENAYTIVESTTHSIAVDVLTSPKARVGTLFVSSADGTYFVESLPDTNRNDLGIVDYEALKGLDGIAIANMVLNREEVESGEAKEKKTVITFDDGSNWRTLTPPAKKEDGSSWDCDPKDRDDCTLNLHSVSTPHNLGAVFSSTAPGFVMAVGSVGKYLMPYEQCDTFLSTDAGLTWRMVTEGAHKYEFGDQGSVLVMADDEQPTDHVKYSYDGGESWEKLDLGVTVRTTVLTTIPDSTSQKFMILGSTTRDSSGEGRWATVFLDFASLQTRQCKDSDFEKWYAGGHDLQECIMGHKQWYMRRKLGAKCYVGNKFEDPVGHDEDCKCTKDDFECDFNFVRENGECVAAGPEVVPAGSCKDEDSTYMGSSGYRKIPGNTCQGGLERDKRVEKPCKGTRPSEGKGSHVTHIFESKITTHYYFSASQTVLLHLQDGTVWQSRNEGYSWSQVENGKKFLAIAMHPYASDRAYLITDERVIYYTTDTAKSWHSMKLPMETNALSLPVLDFHPTKADWLIFTGSVDCGSSLSTNCHAVAYYSKDHGSGWREIEKYVKTCQWARDQQLKIDERMIICESYETKRGSQKTAGDNQLQLVAGQNFYSNKKSIFPSIVGWTTFSQYMLVAQLKEKGVLDLQVSLDGTHFAQAQFPPNMKIENHAYTILESNTDSVFVHMTMNTKAGSEWGSIFKSNSNGTYYTLSVEYVNRDSRGYVDFEKMIGLDGIVMVNIVANPDSMDISGTKKIQSRITHNDGGTWKPLTPPDKDSLGQAYKCTSTKCGLHVHGYTERRDPKATYSSPSAIGLMLAVGNVGEELAPYKESDIFLTRDGGFTWEEVHKDAHMWEYGDSGSVIVLVNDEEPVDHVLYSTDEGLSWHSYSFEKRLRVTTIQTVPEDTSRRFFLIGTDPSDRGKSVLVHLDFTALTNKKCVLDPADPNHDDFELWSPSENRAEECLFGRKTLYHRRIRTANCYIGQQIDHPRTIERNCTCTAADFECSFNHVRNSKGECVLFDGATPLSLDSTEEEQCTGFESTWYERTAYQKIPFSTCEGGDRPDRGKAHGCPGLIGSPGSMGGLFWGSIAILPFACAALAGWWYLTKGSRTGSIRLGEHRAYGGNGGAAGVLSTLASVPYFLLGLVSAGWSALERRVPFLDGLFSRRTPYRALPLDEDAEILGGNYEDDD